MVWGQKERQEIKKNTILIAGADLGFYPGRGGGGQKDPILAKLCAPLTFGNFSARAPPPPPPPPLSKFVYIGAQGAFKKILGRSAKNGYLKIVQRGTLWVGRGLNL